MITRQHALVHLGGTPAIGLFIVSLVAFVAETQLSQYVQSDLGFRHPYLIFYMVHSTFAIMFPLHILYLYATAQHSIPSLWKSVITTIHRHLSPGKAASDVLSVSAFPMRRFILLVLLLTVGMSAPALLWFIAVVMAPVTDVTALWNTNAFFAYVFAVLMAIAKWEVRRLSAVVIATLGAAAVVYGSSTTVDKPDLSSVDGPPQSRKGTPSPALVGDLLTLMASIIYGAYQVLYKIYAALPSDPELQADDLYSVLATSPDDPTNDVEDTLEEESVIVADEIVHPLPFGLHPNLLTSAIGICTMLVLWIPIPILHLLNVDRFQLPPNGVTYCVIAGIALSGTVFNAGFMVLLGVWGPIVTSVGSLLTIVLVFLSDAIFGGAVDTVTVWSVLGCGSIIFAFAILAYEMTKGR